MVVTQEDQDNADEQKQRESMHALIQTWMESLQLISLIVSKIPKYLLVSPNYKAHVELFALFRQRSLSQLRLLCLECQCLPGTTPVYQQRVN